MNVPKPFRKVPWFLALVLGPSIIIISFGVKYGFSNTLMFILGVVVGGPGYWAWRVIVDES